MVLRIPPCGQERRVYRSELGPWDGVSKNYLRRVNGPYLSCVPARLAAAPMDVPSPLMALVSEARGAAERVDQALAAAAYDLPSVLLRSESASSSRIENLTVSAKKVALAQAGRPPSPNARLNIANIDAMERALGSTGISRLTLEQVQETLVEEEGLKGVRDGVVWVSGNRYGPREAAFVPPAAEHLEDALDDLVAFGRRDDIDPVVKAFVFHGQLETIHPFADGNGRCGRAMVHLMLREAGVCENSCLPLSAGLLADIGSYHRALDLFREGDAGPLVALMADSLAQAAATAAGLKGTMDGFVRDWAAEVGGRAGSAARRLGPLFVSHPAMAAPQAASLLGVGANAASKALARALEAGMVTREGSARSTVYVANRVVEAVEAACDSMPLRTSAAGGRP